MPKRILAIAFAAGVLALAACNGSGNINNLYGFSTPTPGPTPTITPNPSATAAAVTVTYQASPLPNQPVAISTPDSSGHAGTAFLTQNTDSTGKTTFTNLSGGATYCFSTSYTIPNTTPAIVENQARCTDLWASGIDLAL